MLAVPEQITGISHPLVSDIYLKHDFRDHDSQSVLVIHTTPQPQDEHELSPGDTYLIELLTDLEDLKAQAEKQIGHFDRVDIRAH